MRKVISVLVVGILYFNMFSIGNVLASDIENELKDATMAGNVSAVTNNSSLNGIYLNNSTATISEISPGVIAVGANVYVGQRNLSYSLTVSVQYYGNGGWCNYTGWSANEVINGYILSSKTLRVPEGYYYCVRATYSVNGIEKSIASNGIWVG